MFARNTDRDWQAFGDTDPYWAVLTQEQYRKEKLTDDALQSFFRSGHSYVAKVLKLIRQRVDADFTPRSVLDFGCGVGRLVIPFAKACESVVGVDVSDGMLREARARCDAIGLGNVQLVKSDDGLSKVGGPFDLVHSTLVFQHIPPARGEVIFQGLLRLLKDDGVGAIHFPYSRRKGGLPTQETRGPVLQGLRWCRGVARTARRGLWNLLSRERSPVMEMYDYDLNALVHAAQMAGARRIHLELQLLAGILGVMLVFRKQPDEPHLM